MLEKVGQSSSAVDYNSVNQLSNEYWEELDDRGAGGGADFNALNWLLSDLSKCDLSTCDTYMSGFRLEETNSGFKLSSNTSQLSQLQSK